jgi:hypothetical protein
VRRRDELRVGVDRDVPLVAVEVPRVGLVSVTRLEIHRGDDAIGSDAARDAKRVVIGLVEESRDSAIAMWDEHGAPSICRDDALYAHGTSLRLR